MVTKLLPVSLFVFMIARRTLSYSLRTPCCSRTSSFVTQPTRTFGGAGSSSSRFAAAQARSGYIALNRQQQRLSMLPTPFMSYRSQPRTFSGTTSLLSSSSGGGDNMMTMRNIGFDEMEDLIDDYEEQIEQGEDPGMVVMDVRTEPEVQSTGRVSQNTITLPLQLILERNLFALSDDDFEDVTGFAKPSIDTTLVFTCAAGIRSTYACQAASAAGYQCVNYTGGANEWFYKRNTSR